MIDTSNQESALYVPAENCARAGAQLKITGLAIAIRKRPPLHVYRYVVFTRTSRKAKQAYNKKKYKKSVPLRAAYETRCISKPFISLLQQSLRENKNSTNASRSHIKRLSVQRRTTIIIKCLQKQASRSTTVSTPSNPMQNMLGGDVPHKIVRIEASTTSARKKTPGT